MQHNPTPDVVAADTTPKDVPSRLQRQIEGVNREKAHQIRQKGGAGQK